MSHRVLVSAPYMQPALCRFSDVFARHDIEADVFEYYKIIVCDSDILNLNYGLLAIFHLFLNSQKVIHNGENSICNNYRDDSGNNRTSRGITYRACVFTCLQAPKATDAGNKCSENKSLDQAAKQIGQCSGLLYLMKINYRRKSH